MKKKNSGRKLKQTPHPGELRSLLETTFARFNRREFLQTDPVQFPHLYRTPREQELVCFIGASLAYGNARVICSSLRHLFNLLGPEPLEFIRSSENLDAILPQLKPYRFYRSHDIHEILCTLSRFYERHESMGAYFSRTWNNSLLLGLAELRRELRSLRTYTSYGLDYWIPDPQRGAAKRLHLFLRWVVRKDEIDLGLWKTPSTAELLIPLDTHLHRIGLELGITQRKTADLQTCIEITNALKRIDASDPIRFDFALSRIGILNQNLR
jgi:uncharacterized protein (TIGR02757 family)